jgi:hypothetical protein
LSLSRRGSRECRVRAAPAVSCARCTKKSAHEHTGSAEAVRHSLRNGLRLMPRSPRRRIRSCHRRCRLEAETIRLDRVSHRQLGTSNGCRDHTVLPYAHSVVRPARREPLTSRKACPAITLRADAIASTASHPAFVTIAIRPSCRERTGRAGRTDLPDGLSEIFFEKRLDDPNHPGIVAINRSDERVARLSESSLPEERSHHYHRHLHSACGAEPRTFETAAINWSGPKGFVSRMLPGTPLQSQSLPAPVM